MAKSRGLGRGLDALLEAADRDASADALRNLPVDALEPGKYQPRTRATLEALSELAESIKSQGVMQPVLARPLPGGRYEIVAGERRWRAARMAGLASVPALVRDMPDQQALAAGLVENMQREDLNCLEAAAGVRRLADEFGLTHQRIAEILGRSRAAVTNLLRLLDLAPPVRELLAQGSLDMGHARALLALPTGGQVEVARRAAQRRLSVRQVEALVAGWARRPRKAGHARVDGDVARLEEEWSQRLGTAVKFEAGRKSGSGKLVIHYATLEQLDLLLHKLGA